MGFLRFIRQCYECNMFKILFNIYFLIDKTAYTPSYIDKTSKNFLDAWISKNILAFKTSSDNWFLQHGRLLLNIKERKRNRNLYFLSRVNKNYFIRSPFLLAIKVFTTINHSINVHLSWSFIPCIWSKFRYEILLYYFIIGIS